jgi:CRISPR-associated protein Cmr1
MWEIFGGIGARTRRGFGALQLISVDGVPDSDLPNSPKEEAKTWIQQQLEHCVVQGTYPPGVPHLSHSTPFRITDSSENVMDVWDTLIKKLASFRQARKGGPHGRSYWPEPEAIRTITGQRFKKHPPLNHPTKFPRAAFGLPIIFHFKYSNLGEPPDTTLEGKREESRRFASPLILRPLVCKDNRAVGVALLLEGSRIPPPGGIVLDYDPTTTVDTQLTQTEAMAIPVLHGQTDVLQAFMNYLGG